MSLLKTPGARFPPANQLAETQASARSSPRHHRERGRRRTQQQNPSLEPEAQPWQNTQQDHTRGKEHCNALRVAGWLFKASNYVENQKYKPNRLSHLRPVCLPGEHITGQTTGHLPAKRKESSWPAQRFQTDVSVAAFLLSSAYPPPFTASLPVPHHCYGFFLPPMGQRLRLLFQKQTNKKKKQQKIPLVLKTRENATNKQKQQRDVLASLNPIRHRLTQVNQILYTVHSWYVHINSWITVKTNTSPSISCPNPLIYKNRPLAWVRVLMSHRSHRCGERFQGRAGTFNQEHNRLMNTKENNNDNAADLCNSPAPAVRQRLPCPWHCHHLLGPFSLGGKHFMNAGTCY